MPRFSILRSRCCRSVMLGLAAFSFNLVGLDSQEAAWGQNWTRFRGEDGQGYVPQSSVPLPWSKGDVRWEVTLPGTGNGSPVVWGDKLFILCADPESATRHVSSLNMQTGKSLWQKSYPSQVHKLHKRSSYASSTPTVDAERVYFAWGAPDSVSVKAFSHDGNELWSVDLGRSVSQHGFGTSPILYRGLLILLNSQDAEELDPGVLPGESKMVALDSKTGAIVWESPRETSRVCYGVPCIAHDENGNDVLLATESAEGVFALDPMTGKKLWSSEPLTKRSVSSTLVVGDLVLATEGSGGGGNKLFARKIGGDHSDAIQISRGAPYVPTPAVRGNLMFLWSDNGIASCVRMPEGEILWSERIGGNVSASPVILGDKLIGISEEGVVTVLRAAETFEKIGDVQLDEVARSTPAAGGDYLLIRTETKLLCVGAETKKL